MIAPSLDTYTSYRAEDIAKEYFSRLAKKGELKGIVDIGSYRYDDKVRHRNGGFDVVLEFVDGYDVFKVKFLHGPLLKDKALEEAERIKSIESFKARRIGFVSIDGFDFASDEFVLIDIQCCTMMLSSDICKKPLISKWYFGFSWIFQSAGLKFQDLC